MWTKVQASCFCTILLVWHANCQPVESRLLLGLCNRCNWLCGRAAAELLQTPCYGIIQAALRASMHASQPSWHAVGRHFHWPSLHVHACMHATDLASLLSRRSSSLQLGMHLHALSQHAENSSFTSAFCHLAYPAFHTFQCSPSVHQCVLASCWHLISPHWPLPPEQESLSTSSYIAGQVSQLLLATIIALQLRGVHMQDRVDSARHHLLASLLIRLTIPPLLAIALTELCDRFRTDSICLTYSPGALLIL